MSSEVRSKTLRPALGKAWGSGDLLPASEKGLLLGGPKSTLSGEPIISSDDVMDSKHDDSSAKDKQRLLAEGKGSDASVTKTAHAQPAAALTTLDLLPDNAFVPLSLARSKMAQLVEDMKIMKEKHLKVVEDISSKYETLQYAERAEFGKVLDTVKGKAKDKIHAQTRALAELRASLAAEQTQKATLLAELQSSARQLEQQQSVHSAEQAAITSQLQQETQQRLQELTGALERLDQTQREKVELEANMSQLQADITALRQRSDTNAAALMSVTAERDQLIERMAAVQKEASMAKAAASAAAAANSSVTAPANLFPAAAVMAAESNAVVSEERAQWSRDKAQLNSELAALPDLRAQIATLTQEREQITEEKAKLQSYIDDLLAAQNSAGGGDVSAVHIKRIESMSTELDGVRADRARLQSEYHQLESKMDAEQQLHTRLKALQVQTQNERDGLRRDLRSSQTRIEALQQQVTELAQQSSTLAASGSFAAGAKAVDSAAVEQLQLRIATLSSEKEVLESYRDRVAQLLSASPDLEKAAAVIDLELARAQQDRLRDGSSNEPAAASSALPDDVESIKQELAAVRESNAKINAEKAQSDASATLATNAALNLRLTTLEAQLSEMKLENAKLKSAVRSGTAAKPVNTAQDAEYRAARAELEQLKAQMAQRESDLQQREAEVQSKEQARAELEAQVEQMSASVSAFAAEKDAIGSDYKLKSRKLKEILTEQGLLKDGRKPKKSDLNPETAALYAEVGDLKKKVADMDTEYEVKQKALADLQQQQQTLITDSTAAQSALVELKTQAESDQQAEQARLEQLEQTQQQLKNASSDHDGQSSSRRVGSTDDEPSGISRSASLTRLQERLREEDEQHQAEMDQKEAEIAALKDQIVRLASGSNGAPGVDGAQSSAASELIADLNKEIATAHSERDELRARISDLEAQLAESMKVESAAPSAPSQVDSSDTQGMLTKLRESESAIEKFKSKLKISMSNTEKLQAKLEEVKEAYKKGKEELKQMKDEAAKAKHDIKGAAGAGGTAASSAELTELKKQSAEDKKTLKKMTDEAEKLKAQIKKSSEASEKKLQEQFAKEKQALEKSLKSEFNSVQTSLTKQLDETKKKADKFETAYQEKKESLDKTEAALNELQRQHEDLEKRTANHTREMDEMRKQLAVGQDALQKVDALLKEQTEMNSQLETARADLKEEQIMRKALRNELEDLKGKIRVYCRARPMNSREQALSMGECVRFPDQYTINLKREEKDLAGRMVNTEKSYEFDHVFNPAINGSQEHVFEETKGLAQSACDGFNVCIFAYGQTGSGKTFTMGGTAEYPGLKPRFIQELYRIAEKTKATFDYEFNAYLIEIYMDQLRDLFWMAANRKDPGAKAPALQPLKDKDKGIVSIKGAIERKYSSAAEMLADVDDAEKCRKTGATKMNDGSSRSHLIFAVKISKIDRTDGKKYLGKLSLVDLAGSESVGKTGADKQRLKEAMSINRSLSALSNVISTLAKNTGAEFVPYRSNILTTVMQDSLGGNAKTLMFVNISPSLSEFNESNSSLKYAALVKTIKNDASSDQESKQITKLKEIIRKLRSGQQVEEDEAAELLNAGNNQEDEPMQIDKPEDTDFVDPNPDPAPEETA